MNLLIRLCTWIYLFIYSSVWIHFSRYPRESPLRRVCLQQFYRGKQTMEIEAGSATYRSWTRDVCWDCVTRFSDLRWKESKFPYRQLARLSCVSGGDCLASDMVLRANVRGNLTSSRVWGGGVCCCGAVIRVETWSKGWQPSFWLYHLPSSASRRHCAKSTWSRCNHALSKQNKLLLHNISINEAADRGFNT